MRVAKDAAGRYRLVAAIMSRTEADGTMVDYHAGDVLTLDASEADRLLGPGAVAREPEATPPPPKAAPAPPLV